MTTTPQVDGLPPDLARRVRLTVSCSDSDPIEKVERAGEVFEIDGRRVQMMHNGVLVDEGCYYGEWMTEIIRCLRGHHEPQEELVFHEILRRLASSGNDATMVELGSFWAYYSLWFATRMPRGQVVALEPDPVYLEVGRRNFELNGRPGAVAFVHGALGGEPGQPMTFDAESTGAPVTVKQYDLRSLMAEAGLTRVDLLLADVQGAETVLLERARDDLAAGRVRFLIVSTHHHLISGDPLTHERALALIAETGGHIIAEHSVSESFSGDGLIAASYDERDRDLTVELSRARARDSLFGGIEQDLAAASRKALDHERSIRELQRRVEELEHDMAASERDRGITEQELQAIKQTKLWRWSRPARQLYGRACELVRVRRVTPPS